MFQIIVSNLQLVCLPKVGFRSSFSLEGFKAGAIDCQSANYDNFNKPANNFVNKYLF